MIVTREISKTVKDSAGKDFKRTATITFEAPDKTDDIAALVASFGSVDKLYQAAYFGVIARAKYNASNELLKGDKASKALKKMAAAIKSVMPQLSDEAAIALVLSNPQVAESFKSEPLTASVSINVVPATMEIPSLNDAPEVEEPEDDTPATT